MLSKLFLERSTVERMRANFVGRHLDPFAGGLVQSGYALATVRVYLGAVQHFGWWLDSRRVRIDDIDERTIDAFKRHLVRCRCVGPYRNKRASTRSESVGAVRRFLEHLRRVGIARARRDVPLPAVVADFESWMRSQRGTGDATLAHYRRCVSRLLVTIAGDLTRLDARAIRGFVVRASRRSPGYSRNAASALRAFVRFLVATGQCASNLDCAVPTVAHWRLSSLPRYMPYQDVERLIAGCDLATTTGLRDRAILLLFARLALRACDVRLLKLSDFDWKHGSVVVSGKTARESRLPLPQEVGDAVLAYLNNARPNVDSTVVFQRSLPPFGPFASGSLSGVVRLAIARAGVKAPSFGTHLLRHSAATEMLRRGATLDQIRGVLRHSSPETTLLYAKVDVNALRAIAQPWPEVAPC
jgi:site-specific recombinase XerD